jgi:hypothetical protein
MVGERSRDLNGDGYADILAGAAAYESGQTDEGAVFLWYGSDTGMSFGRPRLVYEGDQASALFGASVLGRGCEHRMATAISRSKGELVRLCLRRCRLCVHFPRGRPGNGGASRMRWGGCRRVHRWLRGGQRRDVNGDGYGDVIIRAPYFDNGQASEGEYTFTRGLPQVWLPIRSGLPRATRRMPT